MIRKSKHPQVTTTCEAPGRCGVLAPARVEVEGAEVEHRPKVLFGAGQVENLLGQHST